MLFHLWSRQALAVEHACRKLKFRNSAVTQLSGWQFGICSVHSLANIIDHQLKICLLKFPFKKVKQLVWLIASPSLRQTMKRPEPCYKRDLTVPRKWFFFSHSGLTRFIKVAKQNWWTMGTVWQATAPYKVPWKPWNWGKNIWSYFDPPCPPSASFKLQAGVGQRECRERRRPELSSSVSASRDPKKGKIRFLCINHWPAQTEFACSKATK